MFGINLKVIAIVALAAFTTGGISGGVAVHKLWKVSAQAKEISSLKRAIQARDEAAKESAALLRANAVEMDDLKRRADDAISKTAPDACLTDRDVERLRSLWNQQRLRRSPR